ncbi:MAG: hypothetical protein LBC69_02060 [Eubacteriaceae bacterium]|nr:hypothetical protein [Eubacteriaceae bacterium]
MQSKIGRIAFFSLASLAENPFGSGAKRGLGAVLHPAGQFAQRSGMQAESF